MKKVLVTITNYDFSDNADYLKAQFARYLPTILIDSDSPIKPKSTDLVIRNDYYPGLWNAAVGIGITQEYEWIFFIASDIEIEEHEIPPICRNIEEVARRQDIGVWTPSLTKDSRCSFPLTINRRTVSIREVGVIEGFIFLCRTDLLKHSYPVDNRKNKYGWGVDIATCFYSYRSKLKVVADDRVKVHHPAAKKEHLIDTKFAAQSSTQYLGNDILVWYAAKIRECAAREVRLAKTQSLDLGCGPTIRNQFGADDAFGIDIRASGRAKVYEVDLVIEKIPFKDSSLEFISAFDFIEHVPRILYMPNRRFPFLELMNEIYRTLKFGGLFLSVTPCFPHKAAFQDPTHVNFITHDSFTHYFCIPRVWAKMYGFYGRFELIDQYENDDKLVSLLRCLKN